MRMKKLAVMALATALSVGSVMTASAAWLQEGSNWRYQNDNGTFQTGTWFRDADGRWYHFDNNGIMQKGWFQDADGKWYFLAYNGVMQVGLIKVDNQVYYMGTSGDLFIGDMKIGNTTYNFGLYGTTNGQPSVPASATYGGNGNQSLNGGGGGSSSGGNSGGSQYVPNSPGVDEKIEEVQDTANAIKENETYKVAVDDVKVVVKGDNKVKVDVVAVKDLELTTENVAVLNEAIQEAADSVISGSDNGQAVVNYNGHDITVKEGEDFTDFITKGNLDKNMGKSVDVTVVVNGANVVYTIQLN